jgi:hypothetical protein
MVPDSDPREPSKLHRSHPAALIAAAMLCSLSACGDETGDYSSVEPTSTGSLGTVAEDAWTAPLAEYRPGEDACGDDGALGGRLYGAVEADLNWQPGDLSCEGMPRPHGEGARLRFSGFAGELELAIIIAMPTLERGVAMQGVPSNVTIIEEGLGRFFSAADLETCWTDIESDSPVGDNGVYRVEGVLYCIAPLAEIGGNASVTLDELEFVGRLGWETGL